MLTPSTAAISTGSVIGSGFTDRDLTEDEARLLVEEAFRQRNLGGQRVLVLIPDGTRTAPIPLFFRLFYEILWEKAGKGRRVAALDYLIALGTHQAMSEEAISRLVGVSREDRQQHYPGVRILNHRWDQPDTFFTAGTISAEESHELSQGMLSLEVPVRINKMVLDYDVVLVCGPVFPHEVVGFSGGSKYLMPGISGPEIINFTHWLGALLTSYAIIGTRDTPVRAVVERVAEMIPRPRLYCCLVARHSGLAGLYIGEPQATWKAAAELSSQVHVRYVEQPYQQVLSVMPPLYDDLWTGAKGMYKLEPVVADGGELVIFAPHITEISYTHGHIIDQVGYHVRDYFLKQWDRFKEFPWGVLAHSTHVRGIGTYADGVERPRIQVIVATGIPRSRVEQVNLGYRDPATIQPEQWAGRQADGILMVPKAGEILFRLKK